MRSILLLAIVSICIPFPLLAQDYFPRAVADRFYRITAEFADTLIQDLPTKTFIPATASLFPRETDRRDLPPGHYLQLKLSGESASATYFAVNSHRVYVSTAGKKMRVRVIDPRGRAVSTARVTADRRRLRWNRRDSSFQIRDWEIDRLQVVTSTDTLFFGVNEYILTSRLRHRWDGFRRSIPGYALLTPYRTVNNTVSYLKRGIGRGNWTWYNYPFRRIVRRTISPPRPINGYITLNQPKFKPGDTLKMSAYLARPEGRPLRDDSIHLSISTHSPYTRVIRQKIARAEKGRYDFRLSIPPDWKLDKTYHVSFALPGFWRRSVEPDISFRLEDYELKEYRLILSGPRHILVGDTIYHDIGLKDINEQPAPEGRLNWLVRPVRVRSINDRPTLTLPDTLYHRTEAADNRAERRWFLPDSLLPPGYEIGLQSTVTFVGPGGERREEVHSFTVDRRYGYRPHLSRDGDSLRMRIKGRNEPDTAWLYRYSVRGKVDSERISLPASVSMDYQVGTYALRVGKQTDRYVIQNSTPFPSGWHRWRGDTFIIKAERANGQPFFWSLSEGGKTLRTERDTLSLRRRFKPGTRLRLISRLLKTGKWEETETILVAPDPGLLTVSPQELHIEIEHPPTVAPGDTSTVSLRVFDQRGRPAAGVRLNAGSYNARFSDPPYVSPTYVEKQRYRRNYQSYELEEASAVSATTPYPTLLRSLGLDSLRYYRLRHPEPEYRHERDLDTLLPYGQHRAHFAPFLTRKGRLQTIHLAYVDGSLAYFHHPDLRTPYSIPVDSGHHRVTLRAAEFEYEKTLYFPARRQLVVSFDVDRWASAGWTRKEQAYLFTSVEKQRIAARLVALTRMDYSGQYYLSVKGRPLQSGMVTPGGLNPVGLVPRADRVQLHLPYGDPVSFRTEFEAHYRVGRDRDRLYPFPYESLAYSLVDRPGPVSPGLPVFRHVPPRPRPAPFSINTKVLPRASLRDQSARVQLVNRPRGVRYVLATLLEYRPYAPSEKTAVYHRASTREVRKNKVEKFPPGRYKIYYIFGPDSLRIQEIELPARGLTAIVYRTENTVLKREVPPFWNQHFSQAEEKQVTPPPARSQPKSDHGSSGGRMITGSVIDDYGEPLIGASILLAGTTTGTITDLDGQFSLRIPRDGKLIVSYTGFTRTEIELSNREDAVVIQMEEDAAQLQEVVVLGYGRLKTTQDVTASVVSVRGATSLRTEELTRTLNGRVAGISMQDDIVGITDLSRNLASEIPDFDGDYRSDFRDYAAFVPGLRTDARGRASFTVRFPDDITAWNTYAVGQDRRRRVGLAVSQIRSFRSLQAQLYLPRFLVKGDRSEAKALAINRTEKPLPVRLFFSGEGREEVIDTLLDRAVSLAFPVEANTEKDSLKYRLGLEGRILQSTHPNFPSAISSDGEARRLPVYPLGSRMVAGHAFSLVNGNQRIVTDGLLPERGTVYLRLLGNRTEQLLADAERIIDYPYECAEQTASRLLGLLALGDVRAAAPDALSGATPKPRASVPALIRRLEKLRRPDGSFAWWPGGTGSPWITLHAYRALRRAQAAGHPVSDLGPTLRYLRDRQREAVTATRLQMAVTLAENGVLPTVTELEAFDTISRPSDYQLLARMRLRQLKGDTVDVSVLLARSRVTATGGRYWGSTHFSFGLQPLRTRLAATLTAWQILTTAGREREAEESIHYLLSQRAVPQSATLPYLGLNTLESALLVDALLPHFRAENERVISPPEVSLISDSAEVRVRDFPYEGAYSLADAATLKVRKSGSGPVGMSLYQRWFEEAPNAGTEGFRLSSRIVDDYDAELAEIAEGQSVTLEVTVEVEADADYALIEIPIPAGCGYADRSEARGPYADHREYRRDRVAVFCERLPAGTHVYRVRLEARFSGTYSLNPPRAEMQYWPTVNGNGKMKRIRVRQGKD